MLGGSYEGEPHSPPEWEAACGDYPFTPSFVGFFHQPSGDYRNIGDARAVGAEAQWAKSPQERLLVSL